MTAAQELAAISHSLTWDALPDAVRERTRQLVLDFFGVALAGSRVDSSIAAMALADDGRRGPALVLGTSKRALPEVAALINGTSAHATELDDVTRESSLHPGVAVIPAALAIAETREASFADFVVAVVAGYEVTIRVGNAIGGAAAYRRGFHPTSVAGTFGAAVAAGLLLGMDSRHLTNALGIAGTMAAGSLEYVSDGTWTKRLNAGWAAHSGVVAAQLCAAGFTGPASALEGRLGALTAFTDAPAPDRLLAGIGDSPLIMTVAVKPYACCRYNHGLIDAALALRADEAFGVDEIRSIRLGVLSAGALLVAEPAERKRNPRTTVDAQFSAPYAVASALVHGSAGVEQYTTAALEHPGVRSLMQRIECFTSDDLDAVYPHRWPATIEIELVGGRVLRHRVEYALGEPENWVDRDTLLRKFQDLTGSDEWAQYLRGSLLSAVGTTPVSSFMSRVPHR